MTRSRRSDLAAAFALLLLYLAITPGHYQSVDGMLIFHQSRSLLYDGALAFREPFVLFGVEFTTSMYGIGLSLLYLPGLVLFSGPLDWFHQPRAGVLGWQGYYVDPVYALGGAPIQALVTAASAFMVARLCRVIGLSNRASLAGMLVYGLGSPALVYSRSDFSQPLTALCWIGAFLAAARFRRRQETRQLAAAAVAVFSAILTRPLEGALLLPATALVCCAGQGSDTWRRATTVLSGAFGAGVIVSLGVNYGRYGAWLHNEYSELGAGFVTPWIGVAGLSISPGRGLLFAFPAVLLSFVGVAAMWRRSSGRPLVFALAGLPLVLLLVSGSWHMWSGGVCWGPRLMLPALPPLAVLAAAGLSALPAGTRTPAAGLALAGGLLWAAPGVLTDLAAGWGFAVANAERSFWLSSYPPLGAWSVLTHLFAVDALDRHAVDIVWFRIARETGFLSLLLPIGFSTIAAWIGLRHVDTRRVAEDCIGDGSVGGREQHQH